MNHTDVSGEHPAELSMTDFTIPDCAENCPYRRPVSGACDHDLEQALVQAFLDDPGRGCPFAPE